MEGSNQPIGNEVSLSRDLKDVKSKGKPPGRKRGGRKPDKFVNAVAKTFVEFPQFNIEICKTRPLLVRCDQANRLFNEWFYGLPHQMRQQQAQIDAWIVVTSLILGQRFNISNNVNVRCFDVRTIIMTIETIQNLPVPIATYLTKIGYLEAEGIYALPHLFPRYIYDEQSRTWRIQDFITIVRMADNSHQYYISQVANDQPQIPAQPELLPLPISGISFFEGQVQQDALTATITLTNNSLASIASRGPGYTLMYAHGRMLVPGDNSIVVCSSNEEAWSMITVTADQMVYGSAFGFGYDFDASPLRPAPNHAQFRASTLLKIEAIRSVVNALLPKVGTFG